MSHLMSMSIIPSVDQLHEILKKISSTKGSIQGNLTVTIKLIHGVNIIEITTNALDRKGLRINPDTRAKETAGDVDGLGMNFVSNLPWKH